MEETKSSAKDTALNVVNTGYNFIKEGTQWLIDNSGNFPEMAENGYKKVKRAGSRVFEEAKEVSHKVRHDPGSLTFMQTVVLFTVTVVGGSILIQQIAQFYDKNLPTLMMGLIKFLVYLVIPMTAGGGVLFGMYLENRFHHYPEVISTLEDIRDYTFKAVDFVVKKVRDVGRALGL